MPANPKDSSANKEIVGRMGYQEALRTERSTCDELEGSHDVRMGLASQSATPASGRELAIRDTHVDTMLLSAASRAYCGDLETARLLTNEAIHAGADRRATAHALLAGVYGSLGRAATFAKQPEIGLRHLTKSVRLGLPGGAASFIDLLIAEAERATWKEDYRDAIQSWQDVATLMGENTPEHVYRRLSDAYARNRTGFGGTPEENHCWGDYDKHELLKWIHETLDPYLYLEIGVDQGKSLAQARCRAIGVEPRPHLDLAVPLDERVEIVASSSDAFFREEAARLLEQAPDLVFIDGMHLFEFALRDFINVERWGKPSTLVVIDDIYPCHPTQAARRRRSGAWTGDVWKLKRILEDFRPDLTMVPLCAYTTGLLLITGLSPNDRTLSNQFDAILDEYIDDVEPPKEVIFRRDGLPSHHVCLERVLSVLKAANANEWDGDALNEALITALNAR